MIRTPEQIQQRKDAVCQAALEFERAIWDNAEDVPQEVLDEAQDLLVALAALDRGVAVDIDVECLDS